MERKRSNQVTPTTDARSSLNIPLAFRQPTITVPRYHQPQVVYVLDTSPLDNKGDVMHGIADRAKMSFDPSRYLGPIRIRPEIGIGRHNILYPEEDVSLPDLDSDRVQPARRKVKRGLLDHITDEEVLAKLSERESQIHEMIGIAGEHVGAVAISLGIPEKTVYTYLQRIRAKVRKYASPDSIDRLSVASREVYPVGKQDISQELLYQQDASIAVVDGEVVRVFNTELFTPRERMAFGHLYEDGLSPQQTAQRMDVDVSIVYGHRSSFNRKANIYVPDLSQFPRSYNQLYDALFAKPVHADLFPDFLSDIGLDTAYEDHRDLLLTLLSRQIMRAEREQQLLHQEVEGGDRTLNELLSPAALGSLYSYIMSDDSKVSLYNEFTADPSFVTEKYKFFDTEFGREVFFRLHGELLGFVTNRLSSIDGAIVSPDDIIQETFIAINKNFDGRDCSYKDIRAFAHGVIRYKVADAGRNKSFRKSVPYGFLLEAESDSTELDIFSLEISDDISSCLDGLTVKQRDVLILFSLGIFSHTELGEILNRTPGAIRKSLHDARLKIKAS